MSPRPHPSVIASQRPAEELVALVFTHGDVPRAVLEQIALDATRRSAFHSAAHAEGTVIQGVLAYSTCLRTEIYAVAEEAKLALGLLATLLERVTGASPAAIRHGRAITGLAAARHLIRVAAGLDSILIGEDEIHGQLRDALRSVDPATPGAIINRLFASAATAGGRVRHETALGAGRPALGRAAASVAGAPTSHDADRIALVVGAGVMGRQAARQLHHLGWSRIAVANRSPERAKALALEVRGTAHSLNDLEGLLARAAVVVSALSDSPGVIDTSRIERAHALGGAPRAIIDLGSPRNVASDVRMMDGITVTDLDGFADAAQERLDSHALAIPAAEAIVEEELHRFAGWWNHRRLVPLVRRLKQTMQSAAECELEALLQGRSAEERESMRRISQAMVNRLLHHPLSRLRHIAGERPEQIVALTQLEALFAPADHDAESLLTHPADS